MSPSYEATKPVFWFITAGKIEDWSLGDFYHEYNEVHAKMTARVAEHVRDFRDYTQLMIKYDLTTNLPVRDVEDCEGWHGLTIHIWSSLQALYDSFQDPVYKASAGKHLFCRRDQDGCFAYLLAEFASAAYQSIQGTKIRSIIFHRKVPARSSPEDVRSWLTDRSKKAKQWIETQPEVLRYRQFIDCTPATVDEMFAGTQFAGGSWQQFCAVEDLVFSGLEEASAFLNGNREWFQGQQKPLIITGRALKVFGTD